MGQIVTVVGAGEGRSGVGTLASPMGNRTLGDPRVAPTMDDFVGVWGAGIEVVVSLETERFGI